jgi:hypothetical protein
MRGLIAPERGGDRCPVARKDRVDAQSSLEARAHDGRSLELPVHRLLRHERDVCHHDVLNIGELAHALEVLRRLLLGEPAAQRVKARLCRLRCRLS